MRKLLSAVLKTSLTFIGAFLFLILMYLLSCFIFMEWLEIPTETNFSENTLLRALALVFILGVVLFSFADDKK